MVKPGQCAVAGAVVGGILLFLVAQIGEAPIVWFPVHLPGTNGMQDAVSYERIVTKFAVIMGVCSGAVVGAIVGSNRRPTGRIAE